MDPLTAPSNTTTRGKGTGTTATLSDYNTYLRMLTTQLRYQDPLDPVNSSDYAAQLAAFSTVEQQVATNQLLGALNQRFDLLGMAQLSGWVGQEALTTGPVHFDGTPVTLRLEPDAKAQSATLVVSDGSGRVLARETVPAGSGTYSWLGGDATGNPLPPGSYRLALESQADGKVVSSDPVAAYAPITEARRGPDGVILRLRGGIDVRSDDVQALRIP